MCMLSTQAAMLLCEYVCQRIHVSLEIRCVKRVKRSINPPSQVLKAGHLVSSFCIIICFMVCVGFIQ